MSNQEDFTNTVLLSLAVKSTLDFTSADWYCPIRFSAWMFHSPAKLTLLNSIPGGGIEAKLNSYPAATVSTVCIDVVAPLVPSHVDQHEPNISRLFYSYADEFNRFSIQALSVL